MAGAALAADASGVAAADASGVGDASVESPGAAAGATIACCGARSPAGELSGVAAGVWGAAVVSVGEAGATVSAPPGTEAGVVSPIAGMVVGGAEPLTDPLTEPDVAPEVAVLAGGT